MKLTEFIEEWMEKRFKANPIHGGWVWNRKEWQFRDAIHAHGLLRIGDGVSLDPYKLSELALDGHKISIIKTPEQQSELEKLIVGKGKQAENDLIDFHDYLVCADSQIPYTEYLKQINKSSKKPMSMKPTDVKNDSIHVDLIDLQMRVQTHKCRIGKCVKIMRGQPTACKYKFPFEKEKSTRLHFYQNNYKNGKGPWRIKIFPKRLNNNRITTHNKEMLHIWRGNVDFTMVHDYRSVDKYITKYATKHETTSNVFQSLF